VRRHRNTIYVTTDGALLRKDGANVVMQVEGREGGRVPAHMLDGIVCLGRITVSQPLIAYCAKNGITISYLNGNGRFLARVEGPVSGNVLLRKEQYRRIDDSQQCPAMIQSLLAGSCTISVPWCVARGATTAASLQKRPPRPWPKRTAS